jgi:hypothetical protein
MDKTGFILLISSHKTDFTQPDKQKIWTLYDTQQGLI